MSKRSLFVIGFWEIDSPRHVETINKLSTYQTYYHKTIGVIWLVSHFAFATTLHYFDKLLCNFQEETIERHICFWILYIFDHALHCPTPLHHAPVLKVGSSTPLGPSPPLG